MSVMTLSLALTITLTEGCCSSKQVDMAKVPEGTAYCVGWGRHTPSDMSLARM